MLFGSHLLYCAQVITKIVLEVSSLPVVLDKKLNFICHYTLHITLSKKVIDFRVLDKPKTKSTSLSYSLL